MRDRRKNTPHPDRTALAFDILAGVGVLLFVAIIFWVLSLA